jgi:hypothetical protein
VIQVSGQLRAKTDGIVIGAFLPIIAVTPYALAHKLSDIAQSLSSRFLKVLLPIASEFRDDRTRLKGFIRQHPFGTSELSARGRCRRVARAAIRPSGWRGICGMLTS